MFPSASSHAPSLPHPSLALRVSPGLLRCLRPFSVAHLSQQLHSAQVLQEALALLRVFLDMPAPPMPAVTTPRPWSCPVVPSLCSEGQLFPIHLCRHPPLRSFPSLKPLPRASEQDNFLLCSLLKTHLFLKKQTNKTNFTELRKKKKFLRNGSKANRVKQAWAAHLWEFYVSYITEVKHDSTYHTDDELSQSGQAGSTLEPSHISEAFY